MFPEELSIRIGKLSKEDQAHQFGLHPIFWGSEQNEKVEGEFPFYLSQHIHLLLPLDIAELLVLKPLDSDQDLDY